MKIKETSFFLSIVFVTAALYIFGCSSASLMRSSGRKRDLDGVVGWLHGNCIAVKNPEVLSGTRLVVVRLDNGQEIVPSEILRKASDEEECYALTEDRRKVNTDGGLHFYTVTADKPIELGIGVIQMENDTTFTETKIVDLNGDGSQDTFSQCATSEGIQFSVWDAAAYESNLIWSGYYYLGYDTEANCPELPER
jgi:hypothetical protein